jgi:hypothetical protein
VAQEVTGHIGDAEPLAAVSDALHQRGFDEIIISTLPWRLSRWLRVDLPSKIRDLGVPVHHVEGAAGVSPLAQSPRLRASSARDALIAPGSTWA